ncbi:MAG: thioredoxin family protein [Candidatus Obscuribacterales bacterium]|nr:thioredoxin family protein [Candidatus Obscuribacterales bacterium]
MNGLSNKVTQKLLALALLTLAIWVPSEFLPDPSVIFASEAAEAAQVGKLAPDFALTDIKGKTWKLRDLKGKLVVLEWFNHGCPFVKKHYESGNMQGLQKTYTGKGVVWLAICSSADGSQGSSRSEEHAQVFESKDAAPTAVLIDKDGKVGKAYGAKTTPHMFVVGKAGKLIYAGAIDDKRGVDQQEIKTANNYVKKALDEALAGKPVSTSSSMPYGCSVKY